MKHFKSTPNTRPFLLASAIALALVTSVPGEIRAQEAPEPPAPPAAGASARHAEALAAAEAEQRAALAAVEAARAELAQRAEAEMREAQALRARALEDLEAEKEALKAEGRELHAETAREQAEMRRVEREERRRVQRELERAHENLRKASREVARVHRELYRTDPVLAPAPSFSANRAVIGVILGNNDEDGVRVLGLSPDGPAERAGLQPGDTIISLMGESLVEGGTDGRVILGEALRAVEPGDELEIVIQRGDEALEKVIVAEERTPFSWHSITRLGAPVAPTPPGEPAAPGSAGAPRFPDAPVVVQSFEIADIDRAQLERELEALRGELAERKIIIDTRTIEDGELVYEFEALSEIGDTALAGTNIWFGMPLTRGLKFAELDSDLASYFDTTDGVLVLQAREDNLLQLRSGDVIRAVNGDQVQRPADVVRALRRVDSGESVELEIVRRQKSETLVVTVPENRLGLVPGGFDFDTGFNFGERFDFNGFVFDLVPDDGTGFRERFERHERD
ncbi:MAG: PDZ domain-containing protein [Xanthomonadales bacterium]|nr:PDZ domain-containing protein [Xanthomonadales bacterium]